MPSIYIANPANGEILVTLRPDILSPNDPIVCSTFDLGHPAPREVTQERAGYSGNSDYTQYHGSRTVTFDLKLLSRGGVTKEQSLALLKSLSVPNRRFTLLVSRDGESQRKMLVRANNMSCISDQQAGTFFTVSLSYVCETGVMDDVFDTPVAIPAVSVSSGLSFSDPPDTTPPVVGYVYWESDGVAFNPGSSNNTKTLTNLGNTIAPMLLEIHGPCKDPTIINTFIDDYGDTVNQRIVFKNLSVPEGSYIEMNARHSPRTALLMPIGSNVYGDIDWTETNWFNLAPGDNAITFVATDTNDSTYLMIKYASRWV